MNLILPNPDTLHQFVQATYAPSSDGFWARLLNGDRSGALSAPEPIDTQGLFTRAQLFIVRGPDQLLPLPTMPSGTYGHFAWDGAELVALTGNAKAFGQLLRAEPRSIGQLDPKILAQLVLDILGQDAYDGHVVISHFDEIKRFSYAGEAYRVAEESFAQIADRLRPPRLVKSGSGWQLTACSLCGWMHEKQALGEESWWFGANGTIRRDPRVVFCPRVFSEIPPIVY